LTELADLSDEAPVVVVSGLPRSGTSLMMQMLEAAGVSPLCDDHRPPDESNPRGYYELEAVRATGRNASWVALAPGRAVKVIHMLLEKLPRDRRYQVIVMERNLDEVLASQERMLERLGENVAPGDPARLAAIFERQLAAAKKLLDEEACFERLSVPYADLIREPSSWARKIIGFLNLDAAPDSLATVVDPTLYRNRK